MDNQENFEIFNIETEKKTSEEEQLDNSKDNQAFINDLPSWDLTPPYETIRRNDSNDIL